MIRTNAQVCTHCIMDANTPGVTFDETRQCNCCKAAIRRMPVEWHRGAAGRQRLDNLVARLKQEGKGKPYDAMIGLSGGIDSAYLAHVLTSEFDLRCLAVHIDAGWNSAAAVANIEGLVRKTGIDLHTASRVARERYDATLSLGHAVGEEIFVFAGDETTGKRALDYLAIAEHLAEKLEWVEARPDADHVSRFRIRDLARHPERLEEVVGEIAMGRSLLER